MALQATRSNL